MDCFVAWVRSRLGQHVSYASSDYEQLYRMDVLGLEDSPNGDRNVVYAEFSKQLKCSPEGWYETGGAIHSTNIQTGPTGKRGPPQKVDLFFRNFSGWTDPIH